MRRWPSRLTSLSPIVHRLGKVKDESEPSSAPGPDPPDVGGTLAAFGVTAVKCRMSFSLKR